MAFGEKERDLLITMSTSVKSMCKKLDKHVEKDESNVKRWVFTWVSGILFTLIFGAYGYAYLVDNNTNDHKSNLEIHQLGNK